MSNRPKPVALLILDGFGRKERDDNAIALAKNMPCWDRLQKAWPMVCLDCSGDVVGKRPLTLGGRLMNPAATVLASLGMPQSEEMTAQSLPV